MIEVKNLSFGYGRESLFRDMEMNLAPGSIYGLLGVNGAGKSTLLKLMTGLLFAEAGTLSSLGFNPAQRAPGFLTKVFFLPEELNLPGITERQYESLIAPFYPDFSHEQFERYLQEFDVPRGRRLTQLSFGQKKKFLLSFGLACNTEFLVLDEPTNGLDIPSKGLFRRLVAEALQDNQIFIISTHQVRDVENLIDRLVILHQGRVLLHQSMAAISAGMRMVHSTARPDPTAEGLLYSEPGVAGYWSVWRGTGEDEGLMDLEVLFNTIISRPEVFSTLFEQQGTRT